MTITATCPRCSGPLDGSTALGLCPRCLLREGLGGAHDEPDLQQRIGDYELIERIAQGGMGVVFKARQVSVGRTVALKMILGGVLATEQEVQRFAAEAEAAANLDHPNIVPIYDIGAHQGRHYYTMKFVEGGDLSAKMDEYRRDPLRAARLIATCARAVHHGHRRGVLHRDLKPANILLDADGVPHVTDFGVAKRLETDAIGAGTLTGTLLGTPAYMAPEQAAGKVRDVTTAADIYSLGAILYHLLTGRPPFLAESLADQLKLIIERPPTRPRAVEKRIDADLETIVLKCLEKDRRARYATAADLADDLDRFAAGEPIRARPLTRAGRFRRWVRRHPAAAALTTLAAVALVTVTTLALMVARQAERARMTEILDGNVYTAGAVAGMVQRQVELFTRAVSESAADGEFREALLRRDDARLRRRVRELLDAHNRAGTPWRTSPAAREPFTSWFAVAPDGRLIAHAPLDASSGTDFSGRDYFRGAVRLPDRSPYVSRLYKSVTDGRYKIAIAVPVREDPRDGGQVLGLLVASIAIDSEFGELELDDAVRQVALVCPLDQPADAAPQYVLLRHPRYARQSEAHALTSSVLARFASGNASATTDPRYVDPLDRDRFLASFARVPGTKILVVVQQRYADAVRSGADPARRIVLWGGAALALIALLLGGAVVRVAAKR